MDSNEIIATIILRNAFYRRQYLLALGVLTASLMVIGVLIWMLIYVFRNPVHPLYFATDDVGKLIEVIPTNQLNMSFEDVKKYAITAVESAYSYDYINYRAQLQTTQKYFTNYGWTKYMGALKASNNLVAVKECSMIITAKVVNEPKILKEGLISGAYAWRMQMPLLVSYWLPPYDDSSRFSNAIEITVIVQRQPILQSYLGLGILQIIGSTATAPIGTQTIQASPDV